MRKMWKSIFVGILTCVLIIVTTNTTFAETSENDSVETAPTVLLGGQTIWLEYMEDCNVFIDNFRGDVDTGHDDRSFVQIGNLDMFNPSFYNLALKKYKDETVRVKYYIDGKIYSEFVDIEELEDYYAYLKNSTYVKMSMYFPNLGLSLGMAHMFSRNNPKGLCYMGNITGHDDMNLWGEKTDDLIGTIYDESKYGVIFKYNKEKIDNMNLQEIQIARKDEIKQDKAYVYTDYGKGLDFYEVKVTGFDFYGDDDEKYYNFLGISNYSLVRDDLINIEITDERAKADDVLHTLGGMSGSPVIQDNKLIGFVAYENTLICAETAYNYIMENYSK